MLAPGFTLFEWLLSTSEKAEQAYIHPGQETAVTAISRYFYREVRGNTSQLIRRLVMRVLKPDKAPRKDDPKVQERLQLWLHEFEEQIIVKFNEELKKYEYLTGPEFSVIDIIVYCELKQVLTMYERPIPPHLSKLNEWFDKIDALESMQAVNAELTPLLEEHKLKEKF